MMRMGRNNTTGCPNVSTFRVDLTGLSEGEGGFSIHYGWGNSISGLGGKSRQVARIHPGTILGY